MKISTSILSLILIITIPMHGSYESARTNGIIGASVVLVGGGTLILCRRSYSTFDKVFETVGGLALIAAGFAGIVLSGEISRKIEKLYYK